jgi:hypothetical protein
MTLEHIQLSFLGIKRPDRETGRSPSSNVEVSKGGVMCSLPYTAYVHGT